MKILYCGDLVGRAGRNAITKHLKDIKQKYALDAVIVNGENAAHGFGLSPSIAEDLLNAGVDGITTGNHIWQQREIYPFLDNSSQIIRPLNYPETLPGKGWQLLNINGKKLLITQVLGRLFMPPINSITDPLDELLKRFILGKNVDAILVDIHAEATSEKLALGYYLDGKVSLVAGTHTHVPTADARILPQKTGYITDVGMCGDFQSVLGFEPQTPVERLADKLTLQNRLNPANGKELTLWGVMVETAPDGLCQSITQIKETFENI
ncbi:MAG: TIGR00282 family metallophosphoesterase [Alphaproteobacteria bacterium]|nr:TIGR00282 family metallophosphoesterase [Alphaproteobacteria bacterium]